MVSLLKILKAVYEDEQKTKESLENKASNLIRFVAIIVTIYTSFFSMILTKQATLQQYHTVLFWLGTISYLIAGVLSLLALWVRWANTPFRFEEFIDEWKQSSISEKQQEEILQKGYFNSIEDLRDGNAKKAFYLHYGFVCAFLGVLLTVILMICAS